MMSLAVAMVGDLVPKARIGRAMGLLGTVSAVGTALGPSLGGALVGGCGWPAVFHVMALAGGAALLLAWRTLPPDARVGDRRPSLDLAGTALLALSLGAYALSATLPAKPPARAALAAGAALGVLLFALVQARSPAPLIEPLLLRDPRVGAGLVALGLVSAVLMATLVEGPFYLSGGLGLDPAATGLVMSVGPAAVALVGVPAGRLADRLGRRAVALSGLGAVVLGSAMMAWLPGRSGVGGYVASLSLIATGYALFQVASNAAVMGAAPDQRGLTSALLALARNLGLVTGDSAMGALFALGSQLAEGLGPAASGDAGLRLTFSAATALSGLALAGTWWSRPA